MNENAGSSPHGRAVGTISAVKLLFSNGDDYFYNDNPAVPDPYIRSVVLQHPASLRVQFRSPNLIKPFNYDSRSRIASDSVANYRHTRCITLSGYCTREDSNDMSSPARDSLGYPVRKHVRHTLYLYMYTYLYMCLRTIGAGRTRFREFPMMDYPDKLLTLISIYYSRAAETNHPPVRVLVRLYYPGGAGRPVQRHGLAGCTVH